MGGELALNNRAGCLPPTNTLSRVCFGKARTPTEARRAAPRLGLYIQDNNVRGVPPLCIVFLDFPSARLTAAERRQKVVRSAKRSLTSIVSLMCFGPIVCLQQTRSRVFVSAKPERQRKRGEPLRAWVFIFKTTMFAAACRACRRSASFSWTFGVAPLVAAPRLLKGRSVGKALPHFRSEPYVALHPRRGFAYISHKTRL